MTMTAVAKGTDYYPPRQQNEPPRAVAMVSVFVAVRNQVPPLYSCDLP